MSPTRSPGLAFYVRPSIARVGNEREMYIVITVPRDQAEHMRHRGVQHVYDTSAQAHAVAGRLNGRRR